MIDINSSKSKLNLRKKFFELRKNISSEYALLASKKIANKAELHHVTAHVYRHCFATFSLAAGAPLAAVRDAMNHKSISTTSLYLHSTEKDVSTYI